MFCVQQMESRQISCQQPVYKSRWKAAALGRNDHQDVEPRDQGNVQGESDLYPSIHSHCQLKTEVSDLTISSQFAEIHRSLYNGNDSLLRHNTTSRQQWDVLSVRRCSRQAPECVVCHICTN